jgi:UDP-N-acetylmuramyl pentapeptide phosphotransferase/UDP-N-acetylglucosamine-1-phosphate transferase
MEQARIFAAAGVALALSFALTPLAIRLAPRVGAVDVPCDGRRMHITPMPRLGGLAIFFAFLIPSALLGMAQETLSRWLLGATLLVLLGILDDVFRLPALVKLVFQILASVIAVSGSGIAQLNLWSMSVSLGAWRAPLSVVWLLACINAHNMIDGLDGLSASVSAVEALSLSVIFFVQGNAPLSGASLLVCGACLGYLPYNCHPARVFMGDTGSLFLGGLVVGGAFMMKNPLLVVVFGIVYIIETASVILQVLYFKLTHGKRLFKMSPIHHHFEKCGWSEIKIVVVSSVVTVIAAVISLLFGLR